MSSALLKPDPIQVPGQCFALVSFVGPDTSLRQKNEKLGVKIRGVFGTLAEAKAHANELMEYDELVDIFVVEMYNWAVIPPDQAAIEDVNYRNKVLDDLMRGHLDNQRKAKKFFEQRKAAILMEGLDAHLQPGEQLVADAAAAAGPSSSKT